MRKLFHFFAVGLFLFALYLVVFCSNDGESLILKSPANNVPATLSKPKPVQEQQPVEKKTSIETTTPQKPVAKS